MSPSFLYKSDFKPVVMLRVMRCVRVYIPVCSSGPSPPRSSCKLINIPYIDYIIKYHVKFISHFNLNASIIFYINNSDIVWELSNKVVIGNVFLFSKQCPSNTFYVTIKPHLVKLHKVSINCLK